MAKGFTPLIDQLAQGPDVRLNEVVLRVMPTGDGVEVKTTRSTYKARKVIVILPLGVHKSGGIAFGAPLDKKRQRSIDHLEMGLLNKCWLRLDRVFWPDDVDWLEHLGAMRGDEAGCFPEFTSFSALTGVPFLVGFNAAATAEELEQYDDAATVGAAMAALRSMFGSSVPDPIAAQVTRRPHPSRLIQVVFN